MVLALERERAIYARVVAAMGHPEPSTLLHELDAPRSRRYSPRDLGALWERALARAPQHAAYNLYLHVPYCKSICTFCNYKRLRVSTREALDEFVSFIVEEARLLAPSLSGARFAALYVGGGTPSVLSAEQLKRLLGALHEAFSFQECAQKNFEFDPMVMTEDRYQVVSSFGFTRYSFG